MTVTKRPDWRTVLGVTDPVDPHRDLAGVLHDVSNTLTVLLGWVAEARAPGSGPEHVAHALKVVEHRARVARDLARAAIGGARIDERRTLTAVVDEVVRGLSLEADRAEVRLEVEGLSAVDVGLAASSPSIEGALDLSQVLTNLIFNALAYAPAQTKIRVAISAEDDPCTITVSDEGPGIEASRREGVFQGDSQRVGGAGIGLRHSRALARARGGDLALLDARAGEGASFRISWPRGEVVPRAPVSAARVRDLEGLQILVVEDDPAVNELLGASLAARGAQVALVANRSELDRSLEARSFDGVLVDLSPIEPDVDGALSALRTKLPRAAIVLVTGNADLLPEAVRDPSVVLVRKPFELPEVAAALLRGKPTIVLDEGEKEE